MPIVEREGDKVTVNLIVPFFIWVAFWSALAVVFDSVTLVVIAALPVMFILGFWMLGLFVMLVAALAFGTKPTYRRKR